MTTQAMMWSGAGTALAIAVAAGVADWRRMRRANLDDAGWVPWRGLQVAALFAAFLLAAAAVNAG